MKIKLLIFFALIIVFFSCTKEHLPPGFEDLEQTSMYDYLSSQPEKYSSFLALLNKAKLDKTLSAYNPGGTDYTLFLPDNSAIDRFIASSNMFSSLNELLADTIFTRLFCQYHLLPKGFNSSEFPFGAFTEPTFSNDYLTVNYIITKDSSFYKINNQAVISATNIKVSNGYIHLLRDALEPVTQTSYDWIENNRDFSIFKEAVDMTGLRPLIDFNIRDDENRMPTTLFVEPNTVFNNFGIYNINDLVKLISPNNQDYTNQSNPLNSFIAYHILEGNYFINNFEGNSTNYPTYSDIPVNIDGTGMEVTINKGKEIFDTIVSGADKVVIDFVGLNYDDSNNLTQSGAVHVINRLMKIQSPSRAFRSFQFYEEPFIVNRRNIPGNYKIGKDVILNRISWTGDYFRFIKLSQTSSASNSDYLEITGDFTIRYTVPKIVPGLYSVNIGAHCFDARNAMIELFVDGKKVGNYVNLTSGGDAAKPFRHIYLGRMYFDTYKEHVIEAKPLIPGNFLWDYITFVPN
jgi:uncharacterized surface protein with fasciclin (FAS1) repeats